MQIQVVTESHERDTSDLVFHIVRGLKRTFEGDSIVFAEAYAVDGLIEILEVRAARGEREILVMNCSRAHIQGVLEWNSCDDDGTLEDLMLHLVRARPSTEAAETIGDGC